MHTLRCLLVTATLVMTMTAAARAEDLLELSSGAKVKGKVTARSDKGVTIDVVIGSRTLSRIYPLDKISALTIGGKREVLGGSSPANSTAGSSGAGGSTGSPATRPLAAGGTRSKVDVESLINQLGRTPPDWFESTPLNYPQSLDLTFPQPPPGGWNNQKNVGQYVWDVVNPNENKWREGVRLMHHLLAVNKDNRDVQTRTMLSLGNMYHNLHEDYARAAFWWRNAGVDKGSGPPGALVHLAECYWRLGSKPMAVELLRAQKSQSSPMIKLWADMGETSTALQLAEALARNGYDAMAYLYAADACRVAGQNSKAIEYYQKVLAAKAEGNQKGRIEKDQNRARASLEAIRLFDLSDVSRVPDGAYQDSSLGYEGQVQVEVVVAGRRIEAVRITQHKEKQFYSALSDTPRKIIAKQGVKGVDATSSATITSEAIINATAKALAGAAK